MFISKRKFQEEIERAREELYEEISQQQKLTQLEQKFTQLEQKMYELDSKLGEILIESMTK